MEQNSWNFSIAPVSSIWQNGRDEFMLYAKEAFVKKQPNDLEVLGDPKAHEKLNI